MNCRRDDPLKKGEQSSDFMLLDTVMNVEIMKSNLILCSRSLVEMSLSIEIGHFKPKSMFCR